MLNGIDVSHWNGSIDWNAVKKSNIDFVMIKAGGSDAGFYKDPMFEEHYAGATNVGLYVGAYYFVGSKFSSKADGIADAKRFINLLGNKKFLMPVALDIESKQYSSRELVTDAVIAFCDEMEKNGYYVVIYGGDRNTFRDLIILDRLKDYDKWVARYGCPPVEVTNYGMWQHTDKGYVNGITAYVDLDYAYKPYPVIITSKNLNKSTGSDLLTDMDIARQVINGLWGNGKERIERLSNAGWNYNKIQTLVNSILKND